MSSTPTPASPRPAATEPGRKPAGWFARHPNAIPLLILLLLAALTRLGGLGYPRSVVFDEVHFGKFVTHYCCDHERFFDIHPPNAKLLIAGTARLFGYHGGMTFDQIGQPYGNISPVPLRLAPALAGAALPLIIFAILRLLGASPPAALFGGLLVVFDNALTTHTRMIGVDAIMLASMFGGLACWLAALRAGTPAGRYGLALACGALLGMGVGSKLIGLAMGGVVGLAWLVGLARERGGRNLLRRLGQGGLILGGAAAIYLLGWVFHFALLTRPGPGDAWYVPTGHFFADLVRTQELMVASNSTVGSAPYASAWWSWPLMLRPIYYWVGPAGLAKIYLLGNPIVWWGSSLLFVVAVVTLGLQRVTNLRVLRPDGASRPVLWLPIAGFIMCYAPFILITRVMFMYHYLAALLFAVVTVVLWLDDAGWTRPGGLRAQRTSYYVMIAALLVVFVLLVPLTYGTQYGAGLDDKVFDLFPR